jgi:hypothetical protein
MLQKKWFQHLIALAAFLLVSLIFCRPALEGKILMASDNFQTIGSLHEADTYIKNTGEKVAGWTGTMFSGMPIYRGNAPNRLIRLVYGMQQADHAHSWDVLLWLMVSFYIFSLSLGISPWICLFSSIAYAFTAFNIMSMEGGHFFKVFASCMIPGTLGGLIFLLRGKWIPGAMAFFLFINLLVGINHTQITYYGMIIAVITGLYFSVELLRKKDFKTLLSAYGILAIGLVLAIVTNIGIFHNISAAEATTRGGQSELSSKQVHGSGLDKDYASSWSMDGIETFTYFIPNFAGGPSSNYFVQDRSSNTYKALMRNRDANVNQLAQQTSAYWGNQPFVGGGFYMGAALFFLFLLYFAIGKGSKKYWLGASFLVILCLALGKSFPAFYNLTFDHLPMYNKFRVPSMINLVQQAVIAVGAALCIHTLIHESLNKKKVYISAGIILGAAAVFVAAAPSLFSFESRLLAEQGASLPDWLQDALRKDRIALMQKDGIRSLIMMALCGMLIWLYLEKKFSNKAILFTGLGVIACFDLMGNAARHLSAEDFMTKRKAFSILAPTAADQQIQADNDIHYRVLNLTRSPFNDAITSYHHKSIGGYHGAKLRRYQELIEYQISKNNQAVLNMLNTKYFITSGQNGPQAQRNPGALGAVWFVDSLAVVQDGDAEMNGLNAPFDPSAYAVIQEKNAEGLNRKYPGNASDVIRLKSYDPDRMVYESNTSAERFAVFSEIYYILGNGSGWHAFIDGEEAPIRKVNFTLRGMEIPAGSHEIVFEFNKDRILRLNKIRTIFSLLTGLIIIGLFGLYIQQQRSASSEAAT